MAKKGIKFTEEHKRKLSEAHKGKKRSEEFKRKQSERMKGKKYKLGKKHSKESRERMSKSMKGRKAWNKGLKGINAGEKSHQWKGGKTRCHSCNKELSARYTKRNSIGVNFCRKCATEYFRKENAHWSWRGGLVPLSQQIRTCFKYRLWRSDVYTRDEFTCRECGDNKGGNLEAHHIKALSVIIFENNIKTLEDALNCEEVWNINNGQTLCKDCHQKTDNFGGNPIKQINQ